MRLSFDFSQDSQVFPSHFVSLSLFCECSKRVLGLPSQFGQFWEPGKPRKSQVSGWKCVGGRGMKERREKGVKCFFRKCAYLAILLSLACAAFLSKMKRSHSLFLFNPSNHFLWFPLLCNIPSQLWGWPSRAPVTPLMNCKVSLGWFG